MWPALRRALTFDALSARDRRAVAIGLLMIVPAVSYVTIVKPYRAALLETRERSAAERALLERELALLAAKDKLPQTLVSTRKSVQRAEGRLVKAANTTSAETQVTDMLEQIAALSRVLLSEVRSVPPSREQVGPQGMLSFRIAVRGESDLEGVVTYLHRIEQNPLMLRITELSLENVPPRRTESRGRNTRPGPRPQLGIMQFTVMVEAFAPAIISSAEELP